MRFRIGATDVLMLVVVVVALLGVPSQATGAQCSRSGGTSNLYALYANTTVPPDGTAGVPVTLNAAFALWWSLGNTSAGTISWM